MSVLRDSRSDWLIISVDDLKRGTLKTAELHAARGTHAARGVILDLGALEYVDSSGLGVLFSIKKELEDRGKELLLANLQKAVSTALQLVHMERVFPIYADVDAALRAATRSHG
ncbi:MAG: STAS domain-containing protein [Kiritimatiellae bacterium]|nr:STAS domain-containing protein [Kiritimatiellia bacterium]MDD4735305.1 STAS domain-containing protein [Kiritimatiellia bacterium]